MIVTLRISMEIRKHFLIELLRDLFFSSARIISAANAVSKRYFGFLAAAGTTLKYSMVYSLNILFGIAGLVYTAGIPIVLFLAAIGKVQ